MSENKQFLLSIESIIADRVEVFKKVNSITDRNSLPSNGNYPQTDNQWYKIKNVICVFVDIRGSTQLSATNHDNSTASIYDLFTGTAIRIFHEFRASYMDIKGDGVFALFNGNQVFRALAAAVSFKTFANETFKPLVKKKTDNKVDIGFHMGIDQKTVLVKQVGLKDAEGRDSRKNEVWAGKTINMASKLASKSTDNEVWVSDRYFQNLNNKDLVVKSCGCSSGQITGEKKDLWTEKDVSEFGIFDFDKVHILHSYWCKIHGAEWCQKILQLDS